jgi:hypothetical protein
MTLELVLCNDIYIKLFSCIRDDDKFAMACLAAANQAAETDHYMKETIRDMIVVCMQVYQTTVTPVTPL